MHALVLQSRCCTLLMVVLASLCLSSVEGRIQLLDPSSKPAGGVKQNSANVRDLKGRLMLPLRSEAGQYGDSNTYFVQLPPSQHYYSQLTSNVPHTPGTTHLRRLLPVNFSSNGRPARVYHWNMPLLRRMQQQQQVQARRHSPHDDEVTSLPKSHRVTKKAPLNKKPESSIYRIMRLEKHGKTSSNKNIHH